jgi:enamine deaminase RidA (YjgF/YER057c/UK114 family)
MTLEPIQPPGWKPPRGYSNALRAPRGARLLFVAGQVAWDAEQRLVGGTDFKAQFRQALANVIAVVEAGGGKARDIASLTIFVVDKRRYAESTRELGAVWRDLMGRHYPAMALVEVAGLLEPGALVEIQAVAAIG